MNSYLFSSPIYQPLTDTGALMPNCYLQFYISESTTPTDVYADASLDTPLANPLVANSAGVFVPFYMDSAVTYRVQLYDENDTLIYDVDPYAPPRDYPGGTVFMFMGTSMQLEAAYPSALWQVCDGTNGTYDLRGRFPIGVSADIDPGEEVGTEPGELTTSAGGDHDHGGATGSTVLVEANLPSHTHFIAANIEGSSSTVISASNVADRASSAGGDTEYRLHSSGQPAAVGLTSAVGSGSGHTHTIASSGTHTHTLTGALPPATGVWLVMRKYP